VGPRAGVHSLFILVRQPFDFLLPSYQRYTKLAVLNVLSLLSAEVWNCNSEVLLSHDHSLFSL
jgi:hypothetical protein